MEDNKNNQEEQEQGQGTQSGLGPNNNFPPMNVGPFHHSPYNQPFPPYGYFSPHPYYPYPPSAPASAPPSAPPSENNETQSQLPNQPQQPQQSQENNPNQPPFMHNNYAPFNPMQGLPPFNPQRYPPEVLSMGPYHMPPYGAYGGFRPHLPPGAGPQGAGTKMSFQDLSQMAMYQPPMPAMPPAGSGFDLKAIEKHINALLFVNNSEENKEQSTNTSIPEGSAEQRSEVTSAPSPSMEEEDSLGSLSPPQSLILDIILNDGEEKPKSDLPESESSGEAKTENSEDKPPEEFKPPPRERMRKVPKTLNYGAPIGMKKADLSLKGNKIAIVNSQLMGLYNSLRPPAADFEKRLNLLSRLQKIVNDQWPNDKPKLHLFGSSANDFCLKKGDIDICLTINESAGDTKQLVTKLGEILRKHGMKKILTLIHARVPIVKFFDPRSQFSCDMCFNNVLALKNTRLLADYSKIDPRVRHLVYIVKYWAKRRQINETYRGTLSSYAYVLMVLHFLQQKKIIPCLQQLKPGCKELLDRGIEGSAGWSESIIDGFDCSYWTDIEKFIGYGKDNKETAAELLERFFHFYTYVFDYHTQVLAVRTGTFLRKEEKNWVQSVHGTFKNNYFIAIEDPFEITHNLGRVVDKEGLKIIRYEFKRAHYELCTTGNLNRVCQAYDDSEL